MLHMRKVIKTHVLAHTISTHLKLVYSKELFYTNEKLVIHSSNWIKQTLN